MNKQSAFINEESDEKIGKENEEEELQELKRKRNCERQRAYYQRQKDLKKNEKQIKKKKKKPAPKSNAERQRTFRQRNAEKSYMHMKRQKVDSSKESVVQCRAVENIENVTLQENQFNSQQLQIYEQRNECITPEVTLHRNTGIPGDGNCLFHSLISVLQLQIDTCDLRNQLRDSPYLNSCHNPQEAYNILSRNNDYGDLDCLYLFSKMYNQNVCVHYCFYNITTNNQDTIFCHFKANSTLNWIHLHLCGQHFTPFYEVSHLLETIQDATQNEAHIDANIQLLRDNYAEDPTEDNDNNRENEIEIDREDRIGILKTILQQDTSVVKQENAIDNANVDATLCSGVKQEFIEIELTPVDRPHVHAASTPAGVGGVDQAVCIKHEPEDTDLDIGPTVLQHMDPCYGANQNTSHVQTENTIACDGNDATLCSRVKQESVEDKCGGVAGVEGQQCDQATPPPVGLHVSFNGVDRGLFIKIKGTELVIVPTIRQHRTDQNSSVVANQPILYSRVQEETSEDRYGEPKTYICDSCQKTFTNKDSMKSHIICVHAVGSYACDECGKSFKCERYLMVHKANVHAARMTKCNVCDTHLKPISLNCHMERMHSDEQLQCTLCGETVVSKYHFQQHMCDQHQVKLSGQQSAGAFGTVTGSQLNDNKTIPAEEGLRSALYGCDKSEQTFTSNDSYSQRSQVHLAEPHEHEERNQESTSGSYFHVRTRHNGELQYECVLCEKTYKSRHGLRYHIKVHHRSWPTGAESKAYTCDYCQKTFTGKLGIKDHIACVHASGSYKCNLCDKSFVCAKYLKTHIVSMHISNMLDCDICGKHLRPGNLKKHMLNMHSGKKLQCKVCGEIMMSKRNLHYHLNSVHGQQSADSPLLNRCGYCQKIYPGKKNLNAHMKYVHGPRCSECKASFISEARLQRHMKSVHAEERRDGVIMPKSSTERVRSYREKQRAQKPPKKPAKSGRERAREYRARQKALKSVVTVMASDAADQLPTIDSFESTSDHTNEC